MNDVKALVMAKPLIAASLFGIAVIGISAPVLSEGAQANTVVVYKSPTCSCCGKWATHMKRSGFEIETRDRKNMQPIKSMAGVPSNMRSCHTALVNGYVIEGHVPASDIQRLLSERPAIKGLAVPGMPMGSPGMEGPRKDRYSVMAIGKDGTTSVYSQH